MSTKLNQAILKVAKSNPEFRQALQAELSKEGVAGDGTYGWPQRNFPKIKQNARMAGQELLAIAKAENTGEFWAHVLSSAQAQQQMLKALGSSGTSTASYMGKVVDQAHQQLRYEAREDYGTVGDTRRAAELTKTAGLKFEGKIVPKDKSKANIDITMIAPRVGEIALLAIPKYQRELDNKIEFLGRMLKNSQARMAANGNTVIVPGDPLRFKQRVVVLMNDTASASSYHVLSVIEADMSAAHIKKV
jgi:hypothetical protein